MTRPTGYAVNELSAEAREKALAWGRERAKDRLTREVRTSLRTRGFRAARLDIEIDTPGEPDGVAFYGPVRLRQVACNDPAIRRPLRFILRHGFSVAASVDFLVKVGNYYQDPRSMTVNIFADPVSEGGDRRSSWPYEPERPEAVNRAISLLERRLGKAARQAAREMLPLARSRLATEAVLADLRGGQVRFTEGGAPMPPSS
jgi:hypothetical protein